MNKSNELNTIDTNHRYAAVSGWLALVAAYSLFIFLSAVIMLGFVNPSTLSGFDVTIYWLDVIFLPILLVVYYLWWKRKKVFPYVMIVFFLLIGLKEVVYLFGDASVNYFNIAVSIVWIGYFIRSQRVKQIFTN